MRNADYKIEYIPHPPEWFDDGREQYEDELDEDGEDEAIEEDTDYYDALNTYKSKDVVYGFWRY